MENIVAFVDQAAAEAGRQRKRQADKLASLKLKQQKLERSIKQLELAESLKTDGGKAWDQLDPAEKWRKEYVLAVLVCANQKLPEELKEGDLWLCEEGRYSFRVPLELCRDRDILLARLARKDFPDNYTAYYWKGVRVHFQSPPLFQLPQEFHQDKEVLIATVSQYPEILLQDFVSEEFLNDSDVFLAYIYSERLETPSVVGANCDDETLFDLISKFSKGIRGDKVLMLQAAAIMSTKKVLENFSNSLAGDFSFVRGLLFLLRDSSPEEEVLGRFAESIRADPDIVLAFVQKNGRCLKHAHEPLKSNLNIVRAACQNDASALAFAGPDTHVQCVLGNDKDFLLDVFSRWSQQQPGDPQLYGRLISPMLKLDRDLLALAQKTGNLSPADLPPELTAEDSNGFWMEMVQRESSFWRILPGDLAVNPAFALAIERFCDDELVAEVFGRFPALKEERSVWQKIIASSIYEFDFDSGVDLHVGFGKHAPAAILQDKALMVCACENDYKVYGLLDSELQQNRDLVEAAISCSGVALKLIPHSVQTPELVIQALQALDVDESREAEDMVYKDDVIASELWTNMDVVRAWFDAGGDFFPERVPQSMSKNVEFGLALVERFGRFQGDTVLSHSVQNLDYRDAISVDLRSNKDFMMRACKFEPYFFAEAVGALRRDVDLAIVAFGGHHEDRDTAVLIQLLLKNDDYEYNNDDEAYNEELSFLYRVQAETKAKIDHFESFVKVFLAGLSEKAGPNCHLPMLMQGVETSIALKKSIASYLGVPAGKELPMLQKVAHSLSNLPSLRHICDCSHCNRFG